MNSRVMLIRLPVGAIDLSVLLNFFTGCVAHVACYSIDTRGKSGGDMKLATYFPSSSEAKNSRNSSSTPPYVFMACIGTSYMGMTSE